MKCPNINSPEYKATSKAVGPDIAHLVYDKNNGHFLDKTPEGKPSGLFSSLAKDYGMHDAIRIKALAYDANFSGKEPTMDDLIRRADPAILRAQMNTRTQAFMQHTLERIKKSFPGFDVNFVVDEDVEGTVHANKKGWVSDGTLNYNLDRISYDTLIHEPFHIYLHVMENRSPDQVAKMREEARSFIDNNHPLARAVRQSNPELGYDEIVDELIVTIAGLSSKLSLLNAIGSTGAVKSIEHLEQIWSEIEGNVLETIDITAGFYNSAFGFKSGSSLAGLDFQNSTIWQVGEAFSQDVFTGRVDISKEELAIAYRATFAKTSNQRDFRLHPNINGIKDFIPYLNNNTNQLKAIDMMSDEGLVKYFMLKRTSKNTIFVGGDEIQMTATEGDALKKEIAEKIIPRIKDNNNETGQRMADFLDQIANGETLENASKIFENKDKTSRYDQRILTTLLAAVSMSNGAQVIRYSDLKNSQNEVLRELYDEAFEGYDPLVIVHQVQDGDETIVDLSIVDITSIPLGANGLNLNGKNLFSSIMDDRKAIPKGVEMTNSDGSFRQLAIGMEVMLMKQKMAQLSAKTGKKHDVRFRSLGVIKPSRKSIDVRMVPDIKELVRHVGILRELPFMNKVSNDSITKVLNDESLYEEDYHQSFVAMMQQYLSQKDGSNSVDKYDLKDLMSGDLDVMLNMLQNRQKYIEGRLTESERLTDKEYLFISGAIAELKFGFRVEKNTLKDMNIFGKHITSTHNVRSMLLQEVIRQANTASQKVFDRTKAAIAPFEDGFRGYMKAYEAVHGSLEKFVADKGSEYFKHLYKRRKVRVDDGEGLIKKEVIIPELHWNKSDPETIQALKEGVITEEDVEWAAKLVDAIEDRFIKNIYHRTSKGYRTKPDGSSVKYTMEDAKKALYESGYVKGVIPVIKKSVNERLFDGDIKGAAQQFGDQMGKVEDIYVDNIQSEDTTSEVADRFAIHRNSENSYIKAGLARGDDGEFLLMNENDNAVMSTNLEKIFRYFMMSSIRKEVYENEVLPYVNNANMLMTWLSNNGMKQDNNKEYLREYVERLVHMRTQDTDEKDTILGLPIRLSKTVRSSLHLVGFLSMGYRPWLGIKSHVFNETQGWMNALANSMTGNDYFGLSDYQKAHNLVFTEHKKVKALSDMFHLVNGTENDLLNNPLVVITDKNLGNSQYSNFANYMSDLYARRAVMVAQMLKEGSYDAYVYDEESGEITYDETLDKRMYDDDGTITDEGKAIRAFLKRKLVEDGVITKEYDEKLPRGHDYQSGQLFKYLSDKYVIGSMDNRSRSMIGNHYLGAVFSQFRTFSIDRLFNFGVDANTRESIFGGTIKAFKDDNGEWVARREVIEIEGQLQSLGAAIKAIKDLKNRPISEWWAESSSVRKANLAKLSVKIAVFSMLYALVKGLFGDDPEREEKIAWLYTDILDTALVRDMTTNMPALVSQVDRLVDITLGERAASNLMRYVPMTSAFKDLTDAVDFIESFNSQN